MARYFTMQELQTMKLYEMPNRIYDSIESDIRKLFGTFTDRIMKKLDNAVVTEIDQYCDIWQYIKVIA